MNKLTKNQKIMLIIGISLVAFYLIITSGWNRKRIATKLMEADIKVTKTPEEVTEELKKQVIEWYLNSSKGLYFENILKGKGVNEMNFFELLKLTFKKF